MIGPCPLCGGVWKLLGQLGGLTHLRCRDCGYDCAVPNEEV